MSNVSKVRVVNGKCLVNMVCVDCDRVIEGEIELQGAIFAAKVNQCRGGVMCPDCRGIWLELGGSPILEREVLRGHGYSIRS